MSLQLTRKLSPTSLTHADLATRPWVALTWRERQRSRLAVVLNTGQAAAVLLPRGATLVHGDVLASEHGEQVLIQAAPESLLEITAPTPFDLLRLVYHLANRHVSAMLTPSAVYIEPDPVLAEMVIRLGGRVCSQDLPFEPEKGAYHGAADHTHGSLTQPGSRNYTGTEHHQRHSHGELDDVDRAMGNIGEELSRQAHDKS